MSGTTEREIAVLTHGRYLVESSGDERPAGLLVGCHGYAENAERHLDKLRRIPGVERWHRVAVQGLHRFYNPKARDFDPRNPEVFASWMTRQGRELAIDDNVRYLASVIAEVCSDPPRPPRGRDRDLGTPRRLVFAGFSQGVAMAYRAAARSGFPCHGLIALAGDVPPDVAAVCRPLGGRGRKPQYDAFPPVLLGCGTEDQLYTPEAMEKDLATLSRMGVEVEPCVFDGGHVWSPEFYRAAGDFLAGVAGDGSPE